MRHRHRWPYILALPLCLFLPSALASPSPTPLARTRHQQQRQVHRLVGGHIRLLQDDDSELITASAGDNTKKPNRKGDEERKTLSQQVADGKYGLIQKELFQKPPKRPGIISYAPNPEVPKDTIATLGGLTKNDIWLAENHLLVIKGGTYPPHDDAKQDYVGQIWQPIDDYKAPLHQVKIPKNPAVPPPFPVQLTEDGPLQILGTNSSRTLNASAETPAYALPPPPGWDGEIPPQNQYFPETGSPHSDKTDPAAGEIAMRIPRPGEPSGGLPFPPALLNGSLPPSFAHLPPGAVVLPPPLGNETNPDFLDEDDPSIYYPPPYSFYYPKDNSSLVPPGPLVPGIILPPPPKFFASLDEDPPTTTTSTTAKPVKTRPTVTTPRTTTEDQISFNEITTKKPPKTVPTKVSVVKNYSKVTVKVHTSRRPTLPSKTTAPTAAAKSKLMTILPVHVNRLNRTYLPANTKRKQPVTVLRPVKTESKGYQQKRPTFESQRIKTEQTHKDRGQEGPVTTTQVPLRYHNQHSSTASNVGGSINRYRPTTPKPPANFYFYEEVNPAFNAITTEATPLQPHKNYYYDVSNQYYAPPRQQYIYVTGRPYESEKPRFRYVPNRHRPQQQSGSNTFSIHIANLQNHIQQYYTTPPSSGYRRPVTSTPKPVYQYSFQAANYRRPHEENNKGFRPSPMMNDNDDGFKPIPKYSVQIEPAVEIIPTQPPPPASYQQFISTQQPPASYQQVHQFNVEEPGYYSTQRPSPQQSYVQEDQVVVTPSRPVAEFTYKVTPNPINQGLYTKPDEGYFDDNTKQYFTIFGRKLPSSTTPLPPTRIPLHGDINVNYVKPRPKVNPLSEPVRNQYRVREPNPEVIKAIEITPPSVNSRDANRDRYIHYPLPGDDGAHFYFLTPQAADRRRQIGQYLLQSQQGGPGGQKKEASR